VPRSRIVTSTSRQRSMNASRNAAASTSQASQPRHTGDRARARPERHAKGVRERPRRIVDNSVVGAMSVVVPSRGVRMPPRPSSSRPRPCRRRAPTVGARRAGGRQPRLVTSAAYGLRSLFGVAARDATGPPAGRTAGPPARRAPPLVLVVGKGGVGKTTAAAAFALRGLGRRTDIAPTLLLSTDPAGTLADALGVSLGTSPAPVAGVAGWRACESMRPRCATRSSIVGARCWSRSSTAAPTRPRGHRRAGDAALPGADEVFALLHLAALMRGGRTGASSSTRQPTGHTLRLLAFAAHVRGARLSAGRDAGKAPIHGTGTVRAGIGRCGDGFLRSMREQVSGIPRAVADPARAAAVIVTRDEQLVAAETATASRCARGLGISRRRFG